MVLPRSFRSQLLSLMESPLNIIDILLGVSYSRVDIGIVEKLELKFAQRALQVSPCVKHISQVVVI